MWVNGLSVEHIVDFLFLCLEIIGLPWEIVPVDEQLAEVLEERPRLVLVGKVELVADNGEQFVEDVLLAVCAARAVDFVKCILLQIDRIDEFGFEVCDEVRDGSSLFADDLHHLVDFIARS